MSSSAAAAYPSASGWGGDQGPEHPKEPEAQPSKIPRRAVNRRADTTTEGACPGEELLTGQRESPRLIVPVDSANPNAAYGPSAFGEASSTISTVFSFRIPASDDDDAKKTCKLVFLFPKASSSSSTNMTGEVEFSRLDGGVDERTTQNSVPDVARSYAKLAVAPGNAYTVEESFACGGGQDVAVELSSVPGSGTDLRFLQDADSDADAGCALGLYILTSSSSSAGDAEL